VHVRAPHDAGRTPPLDLIGLQAVRNHDLLNGGVPRCSRRSRRRTAWP
jgi:hypothetical protein